jgi:DNA-binding MarR family transcriptional regulator
MARPNREEMVEGLLELAAKLFRVTLPIVPREILDLDVTMTQLKIMFLLFVDGPKRMSDLAADLGVTLATASGLADRLVERDIVVRESQPDDRRVVLCRLTRSGQKAISHIWESAGNRVRELLRTLDTGNLQVLTGVLVTMLASAEREKREDTTKKEFKRSVK